MGLYSRDYHRDLNRARSTWGVDGLIPVIKFLIIANVAVSLLELKKDYPELDKAVQ